MTSDSRHIISTKQFFDRAILDQLFASAAEMKAGHYKPDLLKGKISANMFFEPSTRTRLSFETAMLRLGGSTISAESAGQFSSASKGESLEDSLRVVSGYADVIILRHPEVGSAERAASVSEVPIINAGDGGGDHPTQALLDVFTIQQELGRVDNLKVAVVGDLKHSRTHHSLVLLLGLYGSELMLISPAELQLPESYTQYLDAKGIKYSLHDSLEALDESVDVVYMNRIQKERFADPDEYDRLKLYFILTPKHLERLKPEARILDPLPRVGEIDLAVDADPRAAYFRQAQNGLYVRMALLDHILAS